MSQDRQPLDEREKFTTLLNRAVRGEGHSRERLFEQIGPRARRGTDRQGGAGRVRATEVIDAVSVDLIVPAAVGNIWENRAPSDAAVGRRELGQFRVEGVHTAIPIHRTIMSHARFGPGTWARRSWSARRWGSDEDRPPCVVCRSLPGCA